MKKFLWLSRHPMVAEQRAALPAGAIVVEVNTTFPANSMDAAGAILALAHKHDCQNIGGVFPAHVAARLATDFMGDRHYNVWFPVSVPAAAKDGEVRGGGFTFSHWEVF